MGLVKDLKRIQSVDPESVSSNINKNVYTYKGLSIGEYSYAKLFQNCTSLSETPRIDVDSDMIKNMFPNEILI